MPEPRSRRTDDRRLAHPSDVPGPLRDTGQAMSENLDLVRSIYADPERGDFSSADWADPEIEFAFVDGPEPGCWTGLQQMSTRYGGWLNGWTDFRAEPEELILVDSARILALVHNSGRGR